MHYPGLLSSGANNNVVAISQTEAAKLFVAKSRCDIGAEAEKMQFANSINNLIAKFIRLEYHKELMADMLVMERIYAIEFRTYEVEKRKLWWEVFEYEIEQLHKAGFVHRHIKRSSALSGLPFDNILLTMNGLRLIDVGISVIRGKVGNQLFEKHLAIEQEELKTFKSYFLTR
jgi:serine/threonine protein kinase